MTEEQEQSLLSFIKTDNVYHKYFDDVLILLKTGLRISELCGLTIMDVDFNHEVVIIDHQLLKSKEQGYYIEILYLIFDYPHKHYTFKHFEV